MCSVVSDSLRPLRLCDFATLPGSSVHGIPQARILKWAAISFSRGSSQPRDSPVSPALVGRFFTTVPPGRPIYDIHEVYIWTVSLSIYLKLYHKELNCESLGQVQNLQCGLAGWTNSRADAPIHVLEQSDGKCLSCRGRSAIWSIQAFDWLNEVDSHSGGQLALFKLQRPQR